MFNIIQLNPPPPKQGGAKGNQAKERGRKELIKIRRAINELQNKVIIRKINETKSSLAELIK